VNGFDWSLNALISPDEGLVLQDVKLRKRYMGNKLGLWGYKLPEIFPDKVCHLKPDSKDAECRSRLVGFEVTAPDREKFAVVATYAVDRLPKGISRCLTIQQRYEFGRSVDPQLEPTRRCEPFGLVSCARFRPILSYSVAPADGATKIETAQLLHFLVDGRAVNSAMFAHDVDGIGATVANLFSPIEVLGGNPLEHTRSFQVIRDGQPTPGGADNFHQTSKDTIEPPSVVNPGCLECVHIHWRWSTNVKTVKGLFQDIGDGTPLIPAGSKQSARITVHGKLQGGLQYNSPVLYYVAESNAPADSFFTHGGWFSPVRVEDLISATHGGPRTQRFYSVPRLIGQDFVFDFSGEQEAVLHAFGLEQAGGDGIKDFELMVGDVPYEPFRSLGRFTKSRFEGQEFFPLPSVKTRYFVVRPLSTWAGQDLRQTQMFDVFRLRGTLAEWDP
jgi:hypothetical protein